MKEVHINQRLADRKRELSNIVQNMFSEDLPHPWYGTCDGFNNGECSVCQEMRVMSGFFWDWLFDGIARSEINE